LVDLFAQYGADLDAKNTDNFTAAELFAQDGIQDMVAAIAAAKSTYHSHSFQLAHQQCDILAQSCTDSGGEVRVSELLTVWDRPTWVLRKCSDRLIRGVWLETVEFRKRKAKQVVSASASSSPSSAGNSPGSPNSPSSPGGAEAKGEEKGAAGLAADAGANKDSGKDMDGEERVLTPALEKLFVDVHQRYALYISPLFPSFPIYAYIHAFFFIAMWFSLSPIFPQSAHPPPLRGSGISECWLSNSTSF